MNAYKMKHVVVVPKAVKACLSILVIAVVLSMNSAHAGNLAISTETRTTPLVVGGTGNYYTTLAGTVTLNAGGSIVITDPQWGTIIMQAEAGTSTININSGGSFDYSGASGAGNALYIGNANAAAIGVINVNGGFLGGAPLTDIVFGRSLAHGEVNISTGSIIFGAAPVFTKGFINFTSVLGDSASLQVIGQNETYFQGLYAAGKLRINGTNTVTFADYFTVVGDTLSVQTGDAIGGVVGVNTIKLDVTGSVGALKWQASEDSITWNDIIPLEVGYVVDVTSLYTNTPWFRVEAVSGSTTNYSAAMHVTSYGTPQGTVIYIR